MKIGALVIINYALKMNELDAKTHLQKGICLENLKRHPQAILSFSRAIELDRNYAKVRKNTSIPWMRPSTLIT
jgi:Flp pilus assembly protein TadD